MTTKSVDDCRNTANWLIKKLDSTSVHVKRKVLLIIKSVSKSGDGDFARCIVLSSEEVKKYCNFRGPSDQVFGDAYNLAVRNAASEALSASFERNDSNSHQNMVINNFGKEPTVIQSYGQMQGVGSGEYTPSVDYTSSSGGIGSSGNISVQNGKGGIGPVYQEEVPKGWVETIKNKMPGMPSLWPFGKKEDGMKGNYSDFKDKGFDSYKEYMNGDTYKPPTQEGIGGTTYKPDSTWIPQEQVKPTPEKQQHQGIGGWDGKGTVDTSGSVETQIIEEITRGSGVGAGPSRQQLSEFCTRCANVNGDLIADLLDEKLENPVWQVRNKALHCIEALIKAKNDAVIKYFTTDSDNIELQTISQTETVALKSQKIMKLLGKEVSREISSKITVNEKKVRDSPSIEKVEKKTTSLLDMDPFSDAPPKQEEDDMFNSMEVKDQKVTVQEPYVEQKQQDSKNSILDAFFNGELPPVQKNLTSPKTSPVIQQQQIHVVNTPYIQGGQQPQIVYIVNQGPIQSAPIRRTSQTSGANQRNQGFDFMKEEKKDDSHFDFIKQEIAQNIRK